METAGAKPTGIVYDPLYVEHDTGAGHPECAERCGAVLEGIRAAVAAARLVWPAARDAGEADLLRCHSADYLAAVEADVAAGMPMLRTGDTNIGPQSLAAARRAAGGVLAAVDAVFDGQVANAFCVVRPPGHHATGACGMGFCVFNNAAVAARYAQARHGIERVLIADWDVHHGNGTQEIFWTDPSVFYFSTHAWPFYPGTGTQHERGMEAGRGFTLNRPFACGAGGHEVVGAFRHDLVRAMHDFQPELVIISAGFDARAGDRIGNFVLTDDDFAELTAICLDIARTHAGGRLVSTLEGGYTLSGLASASAAHVATLPSGADPTRD